MLQADQSDFAFDTKVIIRQQGDVLAVLRGDDAMAFLEGLPRIGSEPDRKAYIARYLSRYFVAIWLAIGKANPLQQVQAYPLDEHSFQPCADLEQLK
ncbi:MAG: hypothetical protein MZV65_28390 [Chromatiales bacterium]|nr:hypothetical protein [Chromatiales bacterium]